MAKTKVELQNYQGESLSPITIASNVLYEDGRNAQEVFEEYSNETFTPTIENSSSMFKVGQGDNVDYSSNVVNGAYESMVLKGKTMVNCIQEPSSQDVVLPYEFEEGRYVTINDTKESGALGVELKGQTLVNLLNVKTALGSKSNVLNMGLKSNTKYIFIADVMNNNKNQFNGKYVYNDGTMANDFALVNRANNGKVANVFTTPDKGKEIVNMNVYYVDNTNNSPMSVDNMVIIEYQEGMENWNIPYFEGMQSVKMPILTTIGKNLYDFKLTVGNHGGGTNNLICETVELEELTTYTISNNMNYNINVYFKDGNSNEIGSVISGTDQKTITFTTPKGAKYMWFRTWSNMNDTNVKFQMEKGSVATTYEPYKSSILSLPEEVVLRRVGEIGDTLNCMTGEFVKRIEEFILDGGENWSVIEKESYNSFRLKLSKGYAKYENSSCLGLCDKFPFISHQSTLGKCETTGIGIYHHSDTNYEIILNVLKTEFSDVSSLRQYLQTNPVTVQYQLETPIITKINLSSTLKSWNTTTHIYSEIPENTLYPTLSHSNPSYPVILKPSTKYSIVANSYSNSHTNSAVSFNLGGATASTTVGNRVTTITTPSTLTSEELVMSGRGNKLNNVMVIEGDVVGDEPYFEGICDCKSPILSNVGKNLVDSSKIKKWMDRDTHFEYPDWIRVKPNTRYITNLEMGCWELFNANKKKIGENFGPEASPNIRSKLMPSDCYYVKARCWGGNTDTDNGLEYYQKNFVLCEGTVITSQEPYKSNTTTFEQKDGKTIVLRSLPNGVCDTLNVETGEYVQRIGEVTKNNSTGFGLSGGGWENKSDVCTFEHFRPEGMKVQLAHDKPTLNCDKVPSNTFSTQWSNSKGIESITQHDGGGIVLSITRDKLLTQDTDGLNTYLQSNPLTIQYELATPIVSTIDVQGFPYAYENGHVQLSSGHNAQSLTPKVEYSVATNRNGQIRSNQKMVERHQKQLDQLQAIILANMVNTQYQQTLTTLNYDLLKKEVGE